MKNKLLLLLKIQFLDRLRWEEWKQPGEGKKKSAALIKGGAFILLGVLLVFYSSMLAYGLCSMKLSHIVPSCASIVVSLLTLFFTILKTNGILFGYRDYDLLMSLPVKTGTVIASRFLGMYLMNLFLSLLIMLPMGVVYGIFEGPGLLFYGMWLVGTAVMPLIPTTVAAALGSLIFYLSSRLKHANLFATLFSFLLVLATLAGSFALTGMEDEDVSLSRLASIGEMAAKQINRVYPVSGLFGSAVAEGKLLQFILFLTLSLGFYALFALVLAFQYKSIQTGLTTWHVSSSFHMGQQKMGTPVSALLKKEWRRLTSCTVYILNMGMGILMALIMTGALLLGGAGQLSHMPEIGELYHKLKAAAPFFITAVLSMTCTSAVSLSLEGRNLWIIKTLPIPAETVLKSKMLFNLLLTIPAGLIVSVLLAAALRPGYLLFLLYLAVPIVYSLFNAVWGMYLNLKFPNYEWESEIRVVKQGISSMGGMFGNLLFAAVPGFLVLGAPSRYMIPAALGALALAGAVAFALYHRVLQMKY